MNAKTNKTWWVTILLIMGTVTLTSCGEQEQAQTGALPTIVSAPYNPPTQAQAKAAYMKGFTLRYDVPVLEYPEEIKARAKAARLQKLKGNKKLLKLNMAVVKKTLNSGLVAKMRGEDKTIAEQLLKHMDNDDLDAVLDLGAQNDRMLDLMTMMAASERKSSKPVFTAQDYDNLVGSYKTRMKEFKIERCHWKPMKKLIGSGIEDMASLYGVRPPSGFDCVLEAHIKQNPRSVRPYDSTGYFIKSASGEWQYFGNYSGVGTSPRRLTLNPKILKNPEKAVKTLPFWELDI